MGWAAGDNIDWVTIQDNIIMSFSEGSTDNQWS